MNAHTSGPWHLRDDCIVAVGSDDYGRRETKYICCLNENPLLPFWANGNLLAAAPDLLAAGRALLAANTHTDATEPTWTAALKQMRAAIAKAEGREP